MTNRTIRETKRLSPDPFPVARRSNRNRRSGSSPGSSISLSGTFPCSRTVAFAGSLAVTVAGPRRTSTGFPFKSCDAQSKRYELFNEKFVYARIVNDSIFTVKRFLKKPHNSRVNYFLKSCRKRLFFLTIPVPLPYSWIEYKYYFFIFSE